MKNTKKSLLASGLALLASVALLAGTTFAWFTDSVTNSGNKIQAGSLKVDLLQLSDTLNDGQKTALGDDLPADSVYVSIADVKAPIFDYDLWEPGYTDFVALEVSNTGSLALKWKLELIANGAAGILGDVIDVYAKVSDSAITKPETFAAIQTDGEYRLVGTLNELIADPDGAAYGVLYAAADADKPGASAMYAGIALHMRETAGNDYQGESIGTTFDLMLNATQYTYEKDGFENDQYDKEAEKELLIGASVKGVAGFEDIVFDSIQEAYAAISPVVNALAGLEQDGVANNEAGNAKFDAVFTDNGIITWTIYGKQTVDNSLLFSFGRKASYYNPSRSIQSLRIVGGNSSAKLVMDQSIVLPYNWWGEEFPTVSASLSNLTLEQGAAAIGIAPSNGYKYTLSIKNCDINGAMYYYWNGDFDLTVDSCRFKNTKSGTYALHVQGNDNGSKAPTVQFVNNTVEGYQRGINLDCQNTVFTVRNNTFKSSTVTYKGALQITQGQKFLVDGNTFESGVKGYAIDLHDNLANAKVEISNNVFDSAKYILNQIKDQNKATVTITYTNNSGTALAQP